MSSAGAENVHWDLTDLYPDAFALQSDLDKCVELADEFSTAFRGRIASLDASGLAKGMQKLGEIQEKAGRASTYSYLLWSTDTIEPERGALLQAVRERCAEIASKLIFFEIEWAALEDDHAERILLSPFLSPYRHYLEVQRETRKHLLTESEEKIMVEKSVTGRSAWNRFFDETLSDARYYLNGNALTQQEVLSKLHDADRKTREGAAHAFTNGLNDQVRSLAFIFNTILSDKATDDRLRSYSSWISARNQSNEVQDTTVEALINAVTGGYDIVARYYDIKKRILGFDELYDYDRYAPIGTSDRKIQWDQAAETVQEAYSAFHPRLGSIVEEFISKNWIDAALSPHKRGGAFSHGAVPSAHPYIFMNFTGRVRDVQTLAHELGHGVHQYLSREQGIFQADTPLTTAETASVFGEMLTFQKLLATEESPENRLAMLMGKIDDTFATVFRQVSMNRFEDRIHTLRREKGELSVDTFSDAWMQTQQAMFSDSVTLTDNYRTWWCYVPHFLHTPGYVYAYAFGELLVLALYRRYLDVGESFSEQYVELLRAGGSDWPHVLLAKMDIDLQDEDFWKTGVAAISSLVDEADSLSRSIAAR